MSLLRTLDWPMLCLWTARPYSTGKDHPGWVCLWQTLRTRDICCFAWCEAVVWLWVWKLEFEWGWEWEWGWMWMRGESVYGCAIMISEGVSACVISVCSFCLIWTCVWNRFFGFLSTLVLAIPAGELVGPFRLFFSLHFVASVFAVLSLLVERTALWNMDWFHYPHFIQPGVEYRKVLEQRVQGESATEEWRRYVWNYVVREIMRYLWRANAGPWCWRYNALWAFLLSLNVSVAICPAFLIWMRRGLAPCNKQ